MRSSKDALRDAGLVNHNGIEAIRAVRGKEVNKPVLHRFRTRKPGERVLLITDTAYPAMLRCISQPPLWLWTRGHGSFGDGPRVAIVGSRRATRVGQDLTRAWTYRLAAAGVTVVSGLAKGIDTAAHQGAIDANGETLAVMGTGLDRIYPKMNASLASEIEQTGMLISEFHPATGARPHHFPQRNRIIAGLCHATIVMEAAKGSGSLITARLAQDEGRDVGIVPGRPGDRNAAGSNGSIRDNIGALVSDVDDVFTMLTQQPDLQWKPPSHEQRSGKRVARNRELRQIRGNTLESCVRAALQEGPLPLKELCSMTGIPRAQAEEVLLDLLLDGHVALEANQRYRWRS